MDRVSESERLANKRRWKAFVELCELIERIPNKTMLRFRGNGRTVLFIKQSGSIIRIIDTIQKRCNKERLPRYLSVEGAMAFLGPEVREKIFQFINDPEVKMELLELPSELSTKITTVSKSTFAKYLQ